jgi:drug/metabolite transporter (DMT)-like permease
MALSLSPASKGFIFTTFAVVLWGMQHPISKNAMVAMDGFTLTLMRYGIACIGFVAILLFLEGKAAFNFGAQRKLALLAGTVGMAGSALLVFNGINLTTPEVAVIILALQPALSAIIEWLFVGKRPPRITIICMLCAFLGIVLVVTRGGQSLDFLLKSNSDQILGEVLVFLGALAWVIYTLLCSRLVGWSSWKATTLTCLPALALIAFAWLIALSVGKVRLPTEQAYPQIIWQVAYVSLAGVLLAMLLWNRGTQSISSLDSLLLLSLMPVITFTFRAFEGAKFNRYELLGAFIVVAALVTNNLLLRRQTKQLN